MSGKEVHEDGSQEDWNGVLLAQMQVHQLLKLAREWSFQKMQLPALLTLKQYQNSSGFISSSLKLHKSLVFTSHSLPFCRFSEEVQRLGMIGHEEFVDKIKIKVANREMDVNNIIYYLRRALCGQFL